MNLFGIELKIAKKNSNSKFVKQDECHRAQNIIKDTVTAGLKAIDTRFDDLKDFILKSGFNR